MFSLLFYVLIYSVKWPFTEGELAENNSDENLLQKLERGYRSEIPIALINTGLEGSPLTDLWRYIVCLNWVVQYVSSECQSEYNKPRCCYPDTCGDKYLNEFGIRKYKLCSKTDFLLEVQQYVPSLRTPIANSRKTESKVHDPTKITVNRGENLKHINEPYEDCSLDDNYVKVGTTIYHNDFPNVTAKETFVENFNSFELGNDSSKMARNQRHEEKNIRYLKTNLESDDSEPREEKISALGSDDMSNDISKAVTRKGP